MALAGLRFHAGWPESSLFAEAFASLFKRKGVLVQHAVISIQYVKHVKMTRYQSNDYPCRMRDLGDTNKLLGNFQLVEHQME